MSGKVSSPFQTKIKQKNSALMISTMNLEKRLWRILSFSRVSLSATKEDYFDFLPIWIWIHLTFLLNASKVLMAAQKTSVVEHKWKQIAGTVAKLSTGTAACQMRINCLLCSFGAECCIDLFQLHAAIIFFISAQSLGSLKFWRR